MKYGLIGEKLGHSFSPRIHTALGSAPYELRELAPEDLGAFLEKHEFAGINVTIPYKQDVIPYLDEIDPAAKRIGAVNTIAADEDGRLCGYNTDYTGMKYALTRTGIDPYGKKAMILGTGGTSKTAQCVLRDMGASEIVLVSRSVSNGTVPDDTQYDRLTYESLTQLINGPGDGSPAHAENEPENRPLAQILINTTPVGMYPNNGASPIDLTLFPELEGVMDVVYNPLKTALLMQAETLGIRHTGGLPMLVAQAKAAAEIFLGKKLPDTENERILDGLTEELENIVLIGMPGSGKTSIGTMLAEMLGREFSDLDECIEEKAGMPIPEIFEKYGEKYFRDLESDVVKEAGAVGGRVIACGGGAVLREENYAPLAQNGYIVQLKRDIAKLPTEGRPLSKSPEALAAMEKVRAPYYERFADAAIDNNGTIRETAEQVLTLFEKRKP